MHVVLVGPGALGSLLTVHLAPLITATGGTFHLLDHRRDRADNLARSGITLHKNERQRTVHPAVSSDPLTIARCDILLLCVKSGDINKALQHAASLVKNDTMVIGIQNGMTHLQQLRQSKGVAAVAVSSVGATLSAPGQVIYGGGGITRFGLLAPHSPVPNFLKELLSLFNQARLEAEIVPDIHPYLWEKLFINVAINAVTAIHQRKNGQLLTSCAIRNTMKIAVSEAVAVAKAHGIPIIGDPINQAFSVCRKTRNNISSMWQDVLNKRPTEIGAINGYIVNEGKRLGIDTPVNADLVRQIRQIERSWREA